MEEISIKEVIEVLLGKKKWIWITTLAFMAAALVYGLLWPKVFVSEAVLQASPININPAISQDASLIGDITSIAQFPVMDINSYAQQMLNNQVLEGAIRTLDLRDGKNEPITPDDLKRVITVTTDEKTNILSVAVEGKHSKAAADLANTLVEELQRYLTDMITQNCAEAAQKIAKQMDIQQEKIDLETKKMTAYAEGPYNVSALESTINSLLTQITKYKSDLNDVERNLQADRKAYAALKVVGESVDDGVSAEAFKLSIPYASDADSGDTTRGPAVEVTIGGEGTSRTENGSDVENIVLTIKKAELETRLIQNEADYDALTTKLLDMESSLSQATSRLAEEKQRYDILQRDYQLAGEIYGQYQKIYQQLPVIAASDLARKNIQILSGGTEAARPENPGILLCLVVGGVLGAVAGMFAVLFRHYWANA